MQNNSLEQFTAYIALLCAKHVDIQHSESDKRFIELNDEKQLQQSKTQLYPLVAIDKLTITYPGANDAMRKNRIVDLLFLDKVENASDYSQIQATINKMERMAEEFLIKIKIDSRDRVLYPYLKNLLLSSAELNIIEQPMNKLYGALLTFSYELPFAEYIEPGRFDENVSFS